MSQPLNFLGGKFTGVTDLFVDGVDTFDLNTDFGPPTELVPNPFAFFTGGTGIGIDDDNPLTNPAGLSGAGGSLAQAFFTNALRGPDPTQSLVFQIDSLHQISFDPNAPAAGDLDGVGISDAVIGEQFFNVTEAFDFSVRLEVDAVGDPTSNSLALQLESTDEFGDTTFSTILATPGTTGVFTASGSVMPGDRLVFFSSIGNSVRLTSSAIAMGETSAITSSSITMTLVIPAPGVAVPFLGLCAFATTRRRRQPRACDHQIAPG
ncbi:MAG: hypothetical protein AAGH71_03610 [Planctomycetota bacterium]